MTLDTGSQFAGYTLGERRPGTGATASFVATRPGASQPVVLDIFDDDRTATAVRRSELTRRITAARRLDHPAIAAILDSGTLDGTVWLAREHVDAAEVRDLPVQRALAVAADAAAALDYAHSRGVLHRNLSTATVCITESRTVLTDFGIPRSEADDTPAALACTAPEQLDGHAVDHRADVYALGCLLYRLLTGTAPYERAEPAAVVRAHLTELPPRPSATGLPRGLDSVVARALAKSPDDRFDNCGELVDAAALALHSARSRRARVLGLAAVLAVIAVAAAMLIGVRSSRTGPPTAVTAPAAARESRSPERMQGVSEFASFDVTLPRFGDDPTAAQRAFDDAMRAALRRQIDVDAGRPFSLSGDRSAVVHDGARVISGVLVTDWSAPGEAPTTLIDTTVIDSVTAQPITLQQLFPNLDAGLSRLSDDASRQLPAAPPDGIAPTEANFANWLATPNGLVVRFDVGQVAPPETGSIEITVPWPELASVMDPALTNIVNS